MNGRTAKKLRRMAREEMLEDPETDLVAAPKSLTTGVNSPNSKRGMYLQLKKAYQVASKGPARQ
ncbi:MAG: hypothetical protein ABI574_04690 [Burkholderiales bacterium]